MVMNGHEEPQARPVSDMYAAASAAIEAGEAKRLYLLRCPGGCRLAGIYRIRGREVYVTFGRPETRSAALAPPAAAMLVSCKKHGRHEVLFTDQGPQLRDAVTADPVANLRKALSQSGVDDSLGEALENELGALAKAAALLDSYTTLANALGQQLGDARRGA